jgi:hypothetical protein
MLPREAAAGEMPPCRAVVAAKDEIAWRPADREGGEEILALTCTGFVVPAKFPPVAPVLNA